MSQPSRNRPKLITFFTTALFLGLACDPGSGDPPAETTGDGDASGPTPLVAEGLGVGVDKNGDGLVDTFDFHADGMVVGAGIDTNGDGEADAIGHDTNGDGVIDALDTTGDGVPDRFATPPPGDGDTGGDGDIVVEPPTGTGGAEPTTPVGNGMPEICDGIDNDEDGNIDNVDAGKDGICDCLNIGTIGRIGPWSDGGNIFTEWLNTRSPKPAVELGDQILTPELLSTLDLIVVLRADTAALGQDNSPAHHAFSAEEVASLEAWVRAGGGLMTTIGYQGDETQEVLNVNLLLAPFTLGYDASATNIASGFLDQWDATHPIANGVTQINVDNGVGPLTAQGTIVAWTNQGEPALVAAQADLGRVVVYGDEWITYDSEWQDVAEQQVELFWLNLIKWMSPPSECQVEIPSTVVR